MKAEETQPSDCAKQEPLLSRRDAMKGFAKAAGAIAVGAAATSQAADQTTGTPEPCIAKNPYGGGPNTGITLPPYYRPTPSVANANTFFPGMEELGADEMCTNPALPGAS
jgi:ribonuclease Z